MNRVKRHGCLAAALFMMACAGGPPEPAPIVMAPRETFTWATGQPISFTPPDESWRRSRYQNGGAEGVDFVLSGSKGEQILVAERFFLGRRDRCTAIRALLPGLETLRRFEFSRAVQKARLPTAEPIHDYERRMSRVVNEHLGQAEQAYRQDDLPVARRQIELALDRASTIRFAVAETVDEVLFTKARNPVYPQLVVDEPVTGGLAGLDTVIVTFTFSGHGEPMRGRRVYVVANNRMFELGFQGLAEHLGIFERLLASVRFPEGDCVH